MKTKVLQPLHKLLRTSAAAVLLAPLALPAAAQEDEWEFMIAPLFLWGMSIDGSAAIEGNEAPLDLNFKDDLLENLDSVFTIHFEARKQRFGLFAEYQYVSLDPNFDANIGPIPIAANLDFKTNMAEAGATFTLSNSDRARWELLAGLRWTDHDIKVDVESPGPLLPERIEGGDDWIHPVLGARVQAKMGERWSFIARGDYGYNGSDNTAWHLNAQFDYRFKNWGSFFVGYRHMNYDYEDNNYAYDAEQSGPQLGLAIYW